MKELVGKNVDLIIKLSAILLAAGILIGRLDTIDSRLSRVENFLDSHVTVITK